MPTTSTTHTTRTFRRSEQGFGVFGLRFTVVTGQNFHTRDLPAEGWKISQLMQGLNPDFFVHTGDILYYDSWAKNAALARWMWQQVYGMPTNVRFHRAVASYFIKDDHDTWMNDAYPAMKTAFMGDFTFAQGQAIFLEQVGMGEKTFRTIRWGRDLQNVVDRHFLWMKDYGLDRVLIQRFVTGIPARRSGGDVVLKPEPRRTGSSTCRSFSPAFRGTTSSRTPSRIGFPATADGSCGRRPGTRVRRAPGC